MPIALSLQPIRLASARKRHGGPGFVLLLGLFAGCTSWHRPLPILPEVTKAGVTARVMIPPDLNVTPAETVIKPGASSQPPAQPSLHRGPETELTTFALTDAIAFALRNSPRLRSARAAIERARGQEQVAFAPFLPQVDLLTQTGVTSPNQGPGAAHATGFILASNTLETHSYAQTELALQWTLYDFGRTGGRYRQSVAREHIAELQRVRADQTVEFDVAAAYLGILLARASRRVQEDSVRRAEAILFDTRARRQGGVAEREDVLRAEVQLSESREALILAREGELDAVARLNNVMGRNAGWPLEVIDLETQPLTPTPLPPGERGAKETPLPSGERGRGEGLALVQCLEQAATQRPEVGLAQQAVAAAQEGREAARAEFLPQIYARASLGNVNGENIRTGWQEGAGLHVDVPLYAGGRRCGELRTAEADIEAAAADAQTILDAISLEVNLAYRGVVAARERIDLSRTAVTQAEENLRLMRVRYRNGNATPTDIVDSEAVLTRSQQRFFSATYTYLAALARLDYAMGQHQGPGGRPGS